MDDREGSVVAAEDDVVASGASRDRCQSDAEQLVPARDLLTSFGLEPLRFSAVRAVPGLANGGHRHDRIQVGPSVVGNQRSLSDNPPTSPCEPLACSHVSSTGSHARGARTHVLLDLDGTLSDSEPGILNSLQWACMIEGFPIPTEDEVRSVIGPPFELGLPSIGIPDDALERVIDRYRERYADTGAYENTLYDGIVEMLDALAQRGYSLSIATAKPEVTAHPILDYFGISERFVVRAGATLTSERRSKAQVIAHALHELGLHADPDVWDHVIMIGDRDHDVLGAIQHHIPCIGVLWGYGSIEELLRAGAVALAESPAEVVELVGREYGWPDS
jgi:phosphoglycolate phosphatase